MSFDQKRARKKPENRGPSRSGARTGKNLPIRPRSTSSEGFQSAFPKIKILPQPEVKFPAAWTWFFDESVPNWVKSRYSPRESWKGKPFSKEDVPFFSRGVEELSEIFTEGRTRHMPAYFQHERFRSSYLLYFLCLQAAKFQAIFRLHPRALQSALAHAKENGNVLRVADLGSGPGTASVALLLELMEQVKSAAEMPSIELEWYDTNRSVLEDGKALVENLASNFPKLRGKIKVTTHAAQWERVVRESNGVFSLIFLGHVLNESDRPTTRKSARFSPERDEFDSSEDQSDYEENAPEVERPEAPQPWPKLVEISRGGGILIVEPASSRTSQGLSRLRDLLLASEVIAQDPRSIWGPCPHAQKCPLAQGKDWCHFSLPAQVPGKWFKAFSKSLGSERLWLKFSYLWLASPEYPAPQKDPSIKLVLSDPLTASMSSGGAAKAVLLCEPGRPGRLVHPLAAKLYRGDHVQVAEKK